MRRQNPLSATVILAIGTLFVIAGCDISQEITLAQDGSGTLKVSGIAAPFAADALDDLAIMGGYDGADGLYESAVSDAQTDLTSRPGVNKADIAMTGSDSWEGTIDFSDITALLGSADDAGLVELTRDGEISRFTFILDRERAEQLVILMPILSDPALSLFSPVGTAGIEEEVYVNDILGFTFGSENTPAIRGSEVTLRVELPGPVLSVLGGVKTGSRSVRFSAPLSRFLVPDKGIRWEVRWANE